MDENIRFISTIVVIIIFLSLTWFYRTSFHKDKMKTKEKGPILGFFILIMSIILAFYLMQDN